MAGEQARPGQRKEPRIRGFQGGHERLRAERLQLVEHTPDRRQEQQERADAQGHDHRVRVASARDRRPDETADGDRQGHEHRDADRHVERPAGAIRQQDQDGGQAPRPDEGAGQQAELETTGTHVRESTSRTTAHHRKYLLP